MFESLTNNFRGNKARGQTTEPNGLTSALTRSLPCVIFVPLLLLAIAGGGIFSGSVCMLAAFYSFASWKVARQYNNDSDNLPSRSLKHIEYLYALIIALIILSIIPLPTPLSVITGADRFEQNQVVSEMLEKAHDNGMMPVRSTGYSFTRNRAGTLRILVLGMAFFGITFLAMLLSSRQKRQLLNLLLVLATFTGIAALVSIFLIPQQQTLWWIIPIPKTPKQPMACFVNRNHLAGFSAMLAPISLALLLDGITHRKWLRSSLGGLSFFILTAAILFSLSRGALIAYTCGMLAMVLYYLFRHRARIATIIAVLLMAAAFTVPSIPISRLQQRLQTLQLPSTNESLLTRYDAWRDTLRIWRHYPLFGAGPNAFRTVHPQHRQSSVNAHLTHAENEYVQLLAETGIVGALIFLSLAGLLLYRTQSILMRKDADITMGAALVGAWAVVTTHAFVDFPLHVPLYALTFAAMLGCGLSSIRTGQTRSCPSTHLAWKLALMNIVVSLAVFGFSERAQHLDSPSYLQGADTDDIARSLVWSPSSWHSWYYLGRKACLLNTEKACQYGESCLSNAGRYAPNNYKLWYQIGMLRLKLEDRKGAQAAFSRVKQLRSWVHTPEVKEP